MKLSILLPTHNRADVLPFAIESVLTQSFTDYELLICGDGCTDATEEVALRYAQQDSRVKWLPYPKGPGLGYANRNLALREASGELIGFMAHDDLVTPDHLALLVAAFEDPGAHLVWSDAVWVSLEGEIVPAVFTLEDRVMRQEFLSCRWNRIPACCFMHRRSAFERVGYWNETIARQGDLELWGRIIAAYGESCIRHVPVLTGLHFRAHWRLKEMAPDKEQVWQILHREPGRLPEVMRWPVAEGVREQEVFWKRMRAEPGVIEALRQGYRNALHTYAWFMELRLVAQGGVDGWGIMEQKVAALREKVAGLKERLADRDEKIQRLQAHLTAARQSKGWWNRVRRLWKGREKGE